MNTDRLVEVLSVNPEPVQPGHFARTLILAMVTGEAAAFDFFGLWGSDDAPPPISKDAIPYGVTFQVDGEDKDVAAAAKVVVTAENHTVIGGLGSAVAEALAEAGLGRPLRRVGLRDTFAEGSRTGPYLFGKYGLSTQALVDAAWTALGRRERVPVAEIATAEEGEYSPV